MKASWKTIYASILSVVFATALMLPALAFADDVLDQSDDPVANGILENGEEFDEAGDGYESVYPSEGFTVDFIMFERTDDGGNAQPKVIASLQTGSDGRLAYLPDAPELEGYIFAGWLNDARTDFITTDTVFETDSFVYSCYDLDIPERTSFTVTFDSNNGYFSGGSDGHAWKIDTDDDGRLTEFPPDPKREGYLFGGWCDSPKSGGLVDPSTMKFTSDTTLYAFYYIFNKIIFMYNDDGYYGKYTVYAAADYTYNGNFVDPAEWPADPKRSGYTFTGWYASTAGTGHKFESYQIYSGPAVLYAGWEKNVVTPDPVDPNPVDPNPVDPNPVDPNPVDPNPVDPNPVDPNPVDPNPVDPNPVDPNPVDPNPVDPNPVDPNPVDPNPVDPNPVDPNPATPEPAAPTYRVLDGENSVWVAEEGAPLEIRVDGEFSNFDHLVLNGSIVDPANYTVREGSTIVSLAHSYLATLSDGAHELQFVYKDGNVAKANFTTKQAVYVPGNDSNVANDNGEAAITQVGSAVATDTADSDTAPKTGDENGMMLIVLMILVSMGALCGMRGMQRDSK